MDLNSSMFCPSPGVVWSELLGDKTSTPFLMRKYFVSLTMAAKRSMQLAFILPSQGVYHPPGANYSIPSYCDTLWIRQIRNRPQQDASHFCRVADASRHSRVGTSTTIYPILPLSERR